MRPLLSLCSPRSCPPLCPPFVPSSCPNSCPLLPLSPCVLFVLLVGFLSWCPFSISPYSSLALLLCLFRSFVLSPALSRSLSPSSSLYVSLSLSLSFRVYADMHHWEPNLTKACFTRLQSLSSVGPVVKTRRKLFIACPGVTGIIIPATSMRQAHLRCN